MVFITPQPITLSIPTNEINSFPIKFYTGYQNDTSKDIPLYDSVTQDIINNGYACMTLCNYMLLQSVMHTHSFIFA